MNDQEFILLLEQYLDGSISDEGRRALGEAVEADPERRRMLEAQTRQHVRLHAQTSRVDFTESQRMAVMVMEQAEKHPEAHFIDILREQSIRERLQAISRGLRAPRNSGPNRYARYALLRIFGPPGITLAITVAIIILLVLFAVPVVQNGGLGKDDLIIEILPRERTVPPEPEKLPEPPTPKPDATAPNPLEGVNTTEAPAPPSPPAWESPEPAPTPATPAPIAVQPAPSVPRLKALPPSLQGRSPEGRAKALPESGGNDQSERAVANALQWLKSRQIGDGSWAGQDPVAMTGLALLAFLAHGELPTSVSYGATVRKALDYLLARQDAKGLFSPNVYAHAIATYALSEAATLTRHMALIDPMERAVAAIVRGQQADGSFDYNYAQGTRFDTSVTGWQIQALKAAKLAGSTHPDLAAALNRCVRFLKDEAFAADGKGFVYTGAPGARPASGATWSMTGVGTLSLQMLDQPHAPQTRAGLRALEDLPFSWPAAGGEKPRVYGSYYVTQAKFQQNHKPTWTAWNQRFQPVLLARQKPDGHWEGGDYDQGSHVYTTALCTLMLEVYYRYLPTYGIATNVLETAASAGDVNVGVR